MQVTSKKDQKQYWLHKDQPYRFVTSKEFSEAFQSFHVGQRVGNDLATSYDKSKSHPAALTTEKYGVNKTELLKAVTAREILLMKRNSFVYIFKLFQVSLLYTNFFFAYFFIHVYFYAVECIIPKLILFTCDLL